MKVKIIEYKPIKQRYIAETPTEKISQWIEEIPDQYEGCIKVKSSFRAADYVGKLYPGKTLGVAII